MNTSTCSVGTSKTLISVRGDLVADRLGWFIEKVLQIGLKLPRLARRSASFSLSDELADVQEEVGGRGAGFRHAGQHGGLPHAVAGDGPVRKRHGGAG